MKVLFLFPDFGLVKNRQGRTVLERGGWYWEGIASLSAVLKRGGHQTSLLHLDGPIERQPFLARLKQEAPDLVALSLRTQVYRAAAEYALWASQAGYRTIAGSYHPTVNPEETIATPGIDMLCIGEGEVPMVELCDRLQTGRPYDDIPGLWVKRDGEIVRNPVGPLTEDLDTLPLPDFELFDYSKLQSSQTYTAMAMLTRGCPYSCTYCVNHKLRALYPNRNRWLRTRTPENAIEYLRRLREVYPEMRYLRIMDDIFHYSEDWLAKFLPAYKKEFGWPFAINHRPNRFTERAAKMLAEAGCYQVYFGVESGNETVRNQVIGRQMSEQQIKDAFRFARENGIRTSAYNMVGLPHENLSRVLDTVKLNAELRPNRVFSPIFCPYPQTQLHDIAVEAGFCRPNDQYEEDVILEMPDFPPQQILFARANFRNLVHLYGLLRALPRFLGKPLERLADKIILSRRLPHGFLTNAADAWSDAEERLKSAVRQRNANFYVFLRDRVVGNRV
ncbi:MAG: B12-binding domain-containing radical SAM protein [Chloroflexi bacterium]|nr:B12-binding domain-containing radical SAM protein [Chloroflexota bacterium]MCL5108513.1 B12-binding domain-containing radical SAM protein [Chloroflexota bacterium]